MRVGIQEDDQLDDATRAFDDLRAEVAVLRRAVEALGPALKENRSPDYSLSLGHIAKTQAAIGTRLEAIEGHPALRMTPAAFGEQLERAVTNASREARREAEDLVQGISGACQVPQRWDAIVDGWRRSEAAGDKLKASYKDARKSGKEQCCSVLVKVPAQ